MFGGGERGKPAETRRIGQADRYEQLAVVEILTNGRHQKNGETEVVSRGKDFSRISAGFQTARGMIIGARPAGRKSV